MQSLFADVEKELPLTMGRETDCRETWPKRWALLKAKVKKFKSAKAGSPKLPGSCEGCEAKFVCGVEYASNKCWDYHRQFRSSGEERYVK